jgi:hypothetical protein
MLRLSQGGRRLIAMFEDLGEIKEREGKFLDLSLFTGVWLSWILLGSWVAKLVFSR